MNDEECGQVVDNLAKHTGESLRKKEVNDNLYQVQRKRTQQLGYNQHAYQTNSTTLLSIITLQLLQVTIQSVHPRH